MRCAKSLEWGGNWIVLFDMVGLVPVYGFPSFEQKEVCDREAVMVMS